MGVLRAMAAAALVFAAVMCAGFLLTPDPVRTHNGPAQFDAGQARARLARILGDETPHPTDSAAEDGVRARLIAEIAALGFAPETTDAFACSQGPRYPAAACGRVRNILFAVGPQDGPAIMASAHYDSVPAGPGASDDGLGVAALLEIARLLRAAPPPRRVLFLLTDGEESGLLGATAFRTQDPRFAQISAVVNLEARGTRGLAPFFETNRPNAAAVRAYAAHAARPSANSTMAAIYQFLPNSTDVAVLRRDGLDVLNMALIDGLENYHTPRDSLANQDPTSLQHIGDNTLGVLRALAEAPAARPNDNYVFTDILSRGFIMLPEGVATALLGLCAAIALVALWRAAPAQRIRAFALPLACLIGAGLLAFALGFALNALHPAFWRAHPELTRAWTALSALAIMLALIRVLTPAASGRTLCAAGAAWFGLIGFAGALALPGLSILFLPISAAYALGALAALAWPRAFWIGVAAAGLAALALWTPMLALLEISLGYDAPFIASITVVLMTLPLLGVFKAERHILWPAVVTIVFVLGALVTPSFSEARPQPLNLVAINDADQHITRISAGAAALALPAPIARLAPFERAKAAPWDRAASWLTNAPYAEAPAADAIVESDVVRDGRRVVRLRLAPHGAFIVALRIPAQTRPLTMAMNGAPARFGPAQRGDSYYTLQCVGRSCEGAQVDLTFDAAAPARGGEPGQWYVTGFRPGLTPALARFAAARPASATPIHTGDGTFTLKRLALAPEAAR